MRKTSGFEPFVLRDHRCDLDPLLQLLHGSNGDRLRHLKRHRFYVKDFSKYRIGMRLILFLFQFRVHVHVHVPPLEVFLSLDPVVVNSSLASKKVAQMRLAKCRTIEESSSF